MNLKKLYQPKPEFKEKTRLLFLSAVCEKFGVFRVGPSFAFKYFIRGAASGVAFMIILTAAATYADQKNVSPENVLYPLKRSHESIKAVFTSDNEKPAFHLELAERRLEEIKTIREKSPQSPKVAGLLQDLKDEVENSFATILNGDQPETITIQLPVQVTTATATPTPPPSFGVSSQVFSPEDLTRDMLQKAQEERKKLTETAREIEKQDFKSAKLSVCESWRGIIESDDSAVRQVVSEKPNLLERFNRKCRPMIENFPVFKNQENPIHKIENEKDELEKVESRR